MLSQKSRTDGKWHSVAFFSKSLSLVEYNYEIYNKKILTIIHTLEEWWHFFKEVVNSMEIWIDYWNLEYFIAAKKLN